MTIQYVEAGDASEVQETGILFADSLLNERAWRGIIYECLTSNDRPNTLHYHAARHIFKDEDENEVITITADGLQFGGGVGTQGLLSWNTDEETLDLVCDGAVLQLGQEVYVHVRNATGVDIPDGTPVMAAGTLGVSGRILITPMDGTDTANAHLFGGLTTEHIANDTDGKVTTQGKIRGIDTTGTPYGEVWAEGDILWLSGTTVGALTNVEPAWDEIGNPCAIVIKAHSNGTIWVRVSPLDEHRYIHIDGGQIIQGDLSVLGELYVDGAIPVAETLHAFIGTTLDDTSVTVTSNGTTILLNFEQAGTGDVRFIFSDGVFTLDCTPIATVALTAGTDTVPVHNFIYIPKSTQVLTVSTSGFPAVEHARIATVVCQSAASLQTDGALKVHAWTDHLHAEDSGPGHIGDLNAWIRARPAGWLSGAALTPTGGVSTYDVSVGDGFLTQLHKHYFPARNTSTGDPIWIRNNFTTPYLKSADLFSETDDSTGLVLKAWYTFVIWGIVSQDEADCKLMCNLPNGSYNNNSGNQATNDLQGFTDYTIPGDFLGTGFLIGAVTVSKSGSTITIENNTDLRGSFPSTGAGGGGGVGYDANAVHVNVASEIDGVTVKGTPVAGDMLLIEDSAASFVKKKVDISAFLGGGDLVDDLSPQLGADLDTNGFGFTGVTTFSHLVDFNGNLLVGAIAESTLGVGVTIENNLLKDGNVNTDTINISEVIYIAERAAKMTSVGGWGQLWIKSDVPNTLYFTDDTGVDHDLTAGGGISNLIEDTSPELGGNLVTGAFTVDGRDPSVDGTKLDGIESGATADQTNAQIETAYNAQVSVVSQVEAEAGVSTTVRRWTAQRVEQAISALGGSGGVANPMTVDLDCDGYDLDEVGNMFMVERTNADADQSSRGQWWTLFGTPQTPMFTNDDGLDSPLIPTYGTFTPTLQDGTHSDSEGQGYTRQDGSYTLIGDMVFYTIDIVMSSLGTLTTGSQAFIGGLPFNSEGSYDWACYVGYAQGLTVSAEESVTGWIGNGVKYINLQAWQSTVGVQSFTVAQMSSNGQLKMSGMYRRA